MGASKASIVLITIHLLYAATAQEVVRRVPQGFIGMRGKKPYGYGESEFYKRKPQFFVGVKGKKAFDPFPDMDYKRAPMGFVGMRGKKESYPEFGIVSNDNFDPFIDGDYKRAPMGFVGMRGKKESYSDYGGGQVNSFDMFSDYYKRAPMGFVGMRGKKESYPGFMVDSYEYVPKSSGSLIGQIDYTTGDNNGLEYPMLNEVLNEYLIKLRSNLNNEASTESPDTSDERVNEVEKRANIHKFFGVRGKKSVQQKRPYDVSFRGKFIGVRGKKDLKSSGAQEIKFLLPAPWPKRRGQGFLGMRGKKSTDEDTALDAEQSSELVIPN